MKFPTPREVESFLSDVLFNIEKPGRYVGGEFNQVVKDWDSIPLKVALAFPDIYDIGFSNQGLNILYDEINNNDLLLAERCFSVWEDMELSMRNSNIPLYSLESKHLIKDFDVLGVSLPYESLYSNFLNMLDLAQIPLLSKQRSDAHPIIIAGGHATFNPAPVRDFVDAFIIGDGENKLLEALNALQGISGRENKLDALSKLDSIYVPSRFDHAAFRQGKIDPIKKHVSIILPDPPQKPLVPNINTTHNRIAVEVMRGCSHGCRFCQAGFITRPVRERPLEQIMDSLQKSIQQTGYDEISLLSLSISDYTYIQDLIIAMNKEFKHANINLSLPSLRVESFSEDLMKVMQKRKGNFTLAPESASETMRSTINKPISDDDLLQTATQIFDMGWTSIKLYFLIGLPGEKVEDVSRIVELSKRVKTIGKKKVGGRVRVSVSVNTFIPKTHTPFQWVAMNDPDTIREKHQILLDGFKNTKLKLSFPSIQTSLLEGWLSRGDEKLNKVIYTAWKEGAKFDAWQDEMDFSIWEKAFADNDIDPYQYSHQEKDINAELPWDFIHSGLSKAFLKKEYLKSKSLGFTSDCRDNCHACGIQTTYDLLCRELIQQ